DGDGHADVVARDAGGHLWLHAGRGDGSFAKGVRIPGHFGRYDVIAGAGDISRDHRDDLLVRERATGDTYVLPGRGDGTFAHKLGPITRFANAGRLAVGNVAGSRLRTWSPSTAAGSTPGST